ISPSGEIVEGDSVTLSCSSDSNPPAKISWFKGGTILGSGRIYSISKISSDENGEYKCKSRNKHGEKYSDTVTLNVMLNVDARTDNRSASSSVFYYCSLMRHFIFAILDAPRSVVVSISPSGEIVEEDSVTLSCNSDSNPPAEIIWFKGRTLVGSGRIYNISKISTDDSGEYKCKSRNNHGVKNADAVTLNVMLHIWLLPRLSISPSGEIVEGVSVTLSCSSDSNPPAEISWFKGGTIVGSGRIYNISNISSDHSGEYKCKSINELGKKYSDAVTLNVMCELMMVQ
uniref:Ig-like domain-containing protein n=1 Tax=Sinocyclocheilus grahami TaxID=75366 RepID=A0A672LDA5_SINGR